jgi:hypothetical protein
VTFDEVREHSSVAMADGPFDFGAMSSSASWLAVAPTLVASAVGVIVETASSGVAAPLLGLAVGCLGLGLLVERASRFDRRRSTLTSLCGRL